MFTSLWGINGRKFLILLLKSMDCLMRKQKLMELRKNVLNCRKCEFCDHENGVILYNTSFHSSMICIYTVNIKCPISIFKKCMLFTFLPNIHWLINKHAILIQNAFDALCWHLLRIYFLSLAKSTYLGTCTEMQFLC